jgi:hypothetical protein
LVRALMADASAWEFHSFDRLSDAPASYLTQDWSGQWLSAQ